MIFRFRAIDKNIFEAIKNGDKKVETRAATDRYSDIKVGDKIIFVCGKENFKKEVKHAKMFKTISSLLKKYKVKEINPDLESKNELERMYYTFSSYKEKIKKFGLIALEFK